jgi:hypothetical protein
MSSSILTPINALIASTIANLSTTPAVKAYAVDPGLAGIDSLPAAVCGLPTVQRTEPDQGESQLSTYDWNIQVPVVFLFDLADSAIASAQSLDVLEAFIKAIDTGTLSASDPLIVDAKVTQSQPGEVVDNARPMLTYDCQVHLLRYST